MVLYLPFYFALPENAPFIAPFSTSEWPADNVPNLVEALPIPTEDITNLAVLGLVRSKEDDSKLAEDLQRPTEDVPECFGE